MKSSPSKQSVIIYWVVSISTTIFICIGFFYWTIVPYMQSGEYLANIRQAFSTGDYTVLTNDDFMFEPDSNVQGIMRSDFLHEIENLYNNQTDPTKVLPVLDKGIAEMEDYLSNHPDYYTYILALANAYSIKADIQKDPSIYALSEKYYKKDLEVIKGRQDITYAYAVSLIKHNRADEGITLIKDMINKNPGVYLINYELAQAYAIMGKDYYVNSLDQFEVALNNNMNSNPAFTKQAYQEFVKYFYEKSDFNNFQVVVSRLSIVDPDQKYAYLEVLDYMKKNNKIPKLNLGLGNK